MSESSTRRSDARLKRPRRSPAPTERATSRPRENASLEVPSSVSSKPAARRQARGCRRPDDRKVVRRRSARQLPVAGRFERRTSAGFPTALGGRSPKVKSRRVHVARDVGCRSGVRGILVPPPRKAARPHEGTASSDGRGPRSGRDPWSSSSRQRCSGRAKGRKVWRAPLGSGVRRSCLTCCPAPSNPWKARGAFRLRALTLLAGRETLVS